MNREQKIALILGFAVILVVGVLVSDHWSRARELELADAAEGDAGVVHETLVTALPGPGGIDLRAAATPQAPAQQTDLAAHELATGPAGTTGSGSATRSLSELPGFSPVEPPLDPPLIIAQGAQDSSSGLDAALNGATSGASTEENDPGRSLLDRLGERITNGFVEAARLHEQSPAPVRTPDQARFEQTTQASRARHTVAKNESLFGIAKRYYGDGNQWRRIAEANPSKVGKDGSVRQGITLEIPGVENARVQTPKAAEPESPAGGPGRDPARPTTYTVKKNDSLSQIAQRLLGSSKRMGEILAANRGRISDPDDIRVGMVLTIPAKS